ncbi:predicted protein [Naegleria gruberi]|uniref:Predicted protein n=1 Tax=Naegleria gruberi TaxID=5762 RepID=D2V875_NAEGR|nr:uncharacterized protein NAEGRDRAFT_65055 [Naegleria gruberi]EFC47129.1 predicted protein [Naegleria gruberi]|eukprot:XP_002679873.1 predicted protein [Naegleria gruberi strain NEG-M]
MIQQHLSTSLVDVIIIGGSFAGLSAAMALGRASKSVLIFDTNKPCNRQTPFSHNFILHDGEAPSQISKKALEQVLKYSTVSYRMEEVLKASKGECSSRFQVETNNGIYHSRKVILASGLKDEFPLIQGVSECWGISVLHCPYCHGYEEIGKQTALISNNEKTFDSCVMISNWAKDLILLTDGPCTLTPEQQHLVHVKNGIQIIEKPIEKLIHHQGRVQKIVFKDSSEIELDVIYLKPKTTQGNNLAKQLGCELTTTNEIIVDSLQKTTVEGVYAAGDATTYMRSVALAVASGQKAGIMVDREINIENFKN